MGFKASGIERKIFRRSEKLSIVERKFGFMGIEDGSNSIRKCGEGFKGVKEKMVRL